jgi:ABC-type nitrate/sulfonate/bicarbonate transport system permease component
MKNLLSSLFTPYSNNKLGSLSILIGCQVVFFAILMFLFPSQDLPSITSIGSSWQSLAVNDGMLSELWISIKTIAESLILSSIISMSIVYLSTATFFKPSAFVLSSFRFLGFAGLTFLFTLWTSGATELKLCLMTFVISVFLVTNMLSEVESITQESVDYVKTLKFKGWRITWENVVLGKLHVMLDLIRQNAAIGWTSLTMVEGITRSQGGIGALLMNQNRHFDLAAIIAIQLTILVYGLLQDYLLLALRNVLCPHAALVRSK